MAKFRVASARIGIIKGIHQQYIRPDTVGASEDNINKLYENSRAFASITADVVKRSGLTSISTDSSVKATIKKSRWGADRSSGILMVDRVDGSKIERFLLNFFVPSKALIGGHVDPDAVFYINSCHKQVIGKSRLQSAQTDIVQRLENSNQDSIIPNRITDRLQATAHADGHTTTIKTGSGVLQSRSSLGDSLSLLADDSLAETLRSLDHTSRTMGVRETQLVRNEATQMETICDGAQAFAQELTPEDNDLINFIMSQGQGSVKYLNISLGNLRRVLGHFEFDMVKTDLGHRDYTQTAELSTVAGAAAQNLINQAIGLMIRRSVESIRFHATNVNGRVEITVGNRWLIPIPTLDIQGIDKEAVIRQFEQTESTIRAELQSLVLPKVMDMGECSVILDVNLTTAANCILELHGRRNEYTLQSGTSSAWTTINTSDTQLATTGLAQKNILRAVMKNVAAQAADHTQDGNPTR